MPSKVSSAHRALGLLQEPLNDARLVEHVQLPAALIALERLQIFRGFELAETDSASRFLDLLVLCEGNRDDCLVEEGFDLLRSDLFIPSQPPRS